MTRSRASRPDDGGSGIDVLRYNREAWNRKVDEGNRWTVPVSREEVEATRKGKLDLLLTPTKFVPLMWYPELAGTLTLCLASAGGQQAPLLAAAGARVTVFDNSPSQLAQDRFVADREGLALDTVEGDMADLSRFEDGSFAFIFHPCSNAFVPEVLPVWRECYRVLRPGGVMLAGFTNPVRYIFDDERKENGNLEVLHVLPYSDLTHLTEEELRRIVLDPGHPLEYSHSLEDQIGGQLAAGFVLTAMFEDRYEDTATDPISRYIPTFIATRAVKM